jgi:hypothetical protein
VNVVQSFVVIYIFFQINAKLGVDKTKTLRKVSQTAFKGKKQNKTKQNKTTRVHSITLCFSSWTKLELMTRGRLTPTFCFPYQIQ